MLRSFWQSFTKKSARFVVTSLSFARSDDEKVKLERRLRGREQYKKLQECDCAVVSFGKSGRTWLRVMMSRYYQVRYGLPTGQLLGFDNFHYMNREIPKIFFTHDNYTNNFTGNTDNKNDYKGKKVVLLIRNPADVTVSQYFQWKFRMKPHKKWLNNYPECGEDVAIFDFMMRDKIGVDKAINFLNGWAACLDTLETVLLVRYEDMRADPAGTLSQVLDFIGTPVISAEIEDAVSFASVDNMRALEAKRVFWLSGGRMRAKDTSNPDSFKVRRAKVGGYRDYFDADEVAAIDDRIAARLDPRLGYGLGDGEPAAGVTAVSAGG